jgi:hypothetical protein
MYGPFRLRPVTAAVLAVALVAACGSGEGTAEPVVAGEGSMPETFPRDFPVPGEAVLGPTLIDRPNHRSEATLTVESDLVSTVQFFLVGLVNRGYVVERSVGDDAGWSIEFVRGELRGSVEIEMLGEVAHIRVAVNAA